MGDMWREITDNIHATFVKVTDHIIANRNQLESLSRWVNVVEKKVTLQHPSADHIVSIRREIIELEKRVIELEKVTFDGTVHIDKEME